MRKPTMWFLTRSDTNQSVQPMKMARGLKFWIKKVQGLYYPCSENKGADQLRGYREADLRLCFAYAERWFSHNAAHIIFVQILITRTHKGLYESMCGCF